MSEADAFIVLHHEQGSVQADEMVNFYRSKGWCDGSVAGSEHAGFAQDSEGQSKQPRWTCVTRKSLTCSRRCSTVGNVAHST